MEDAEADKEDLERRKLERQKAAAGSSNSGGSGQSGEDEARDQVNRESSDGSDESTPAKKEASADDLDSDAPEVESADPDLDEDAQAEAVEPLIGEYAGYAGDTLALLYTPLFVALLWAFYEETVVARLYGIARQDFVFYFLFSLVIAPAQIVIDVCFLNIVEWYHRLPLHDYLDYMAHRFKTRKASWKGHEPFVNRQLEPDVRSLDQLCFSAQHYFVQTLWVAGMSQMVLAIQVLLWAPGYNLFADLGTLPVLLSTWALCTLLERGSVAAGRAAGLWKIDESVERLEGPAEKVDLTALFRAQEEPTQEEGRGAASAVPEKVAFAPSQWRVIE